MRAHFYCTLILLILSLLHCVHVHAQAYNDTTSIISSDSAHKKHHRRHSLPKAEPLRTDETSTDISTKTDTSATHLSSYSKINKHSKHFKTNMFVIVGYKTAFVKKDSSNSISSDDNSNKNGGQGDSSSVTNITSPLVTDSAQILLDSARYFVKKGEYAEASSFSMAVIAHYPKAPQYAEAIFLHGQAALSSNDDATAIEDFNNTILATKDKPGLASETYMWLGFVYYKQNKTDNALLYFDKAIKTDSSNPRIHLALFYRANCYREKEQIMPAIINYTAFINADNSTSKYSADALFNRAFFKMRLGDDRGGIRDYDKALEIYKNNPPVKNDANAQKEFQEKVIQVLIQRALAKSNIELYNDAIADYNEVLKYRPGYALAFRLRGLAKIKKGAKNDGCLDLSHAGELGSVDAYDDIKKNCK